MVISKHLVIGFLLLLHLSLIGQNNALSFNGAGDYVEMSDHNDLDFIDSLSIEAWVRPLQDNPGNQVLVSKQWCAGSDFAYYLGVFNGKLKFTWNTTGNCNDPSSYDSDSVLIQASQCTHVAIVFNTSSVQFYVNGAPVSGTLAVGNYGMINNSTSPLRVGCYRNYSGAMTNFFLGELDEVRVWDHQLSQTEISARMMTNLTGGESGLVAYYDMNGNGSGAGITVANSAISTGASINGTTYGSSTTPSHTISCFTPQGIEQERTASVLQFYPNPSKGIFSIMSNGSAVRSSVHYEVFDVSGRSIMENSVRSNSINVSSLHNGVYLVRVSIEGKLYCAKLIIDK